MRWNAIWHMTLALSLLLPAAASAAPGTRIDLEVHDSAHDGAGAPRIEHVWITSDRVRVDLGTDLRIYDAGTGRYLAGDRAAKTFYVQDRRSLSESSMVAPDAFVGLAVDDSTGAPRVPAEAFRRTGRTHAWQDRDAVEFVSAEPDVEGATDHLWMAPEPIAWKAMLQVIRSVYCARGCALESWYDQAEALPGFPVRLQRVAGDGTQTTTVAAIESVDVPDGTFDAPPGWRHVDDPAGLSPAE